MTKEKNKISKEISMKQLELRPYSRQEIADVLGVNIEDTSHFKRNVENTLLKWGYSFEYSRKQVKILRAPTSAAERLSELMIRLYDLDIQTDIYAFSCFLYSIAVYPEFNTAPWVEKSRILEDEFSVVVNDRTLRSWCTKLIDCGTLVKNKEQRSCWITGYYNGEKYRELVDGDQHLEETAARYRRDMSYAMKRLNDWNEVFSEMWEKYHFCVYYCYGFSFSAFDARANHETIGHIIDLVNEITERGPVEYSHTVYQELIEKKVS